MVSGQKKILGQQFHLKLCISVYLIWGKKLMKKILSFIISLNVLCVQRAISTPTKVVNGPKTKFLSIGVYLSAGVGVIQMEGNLVVKDT